MLTPLFFQGIINDPSKIKSGVNWKKIIGRKPIDKEKEDLYKNYSDINIKAFIILSMIFFKIYIFSII